MAYDTAAGLVVRSGPLFADACSAVGIELGTAFIVDRTVAYPCVRVPVHGPGGCPVTVVLLTKPVAAVEDFAVRWTGEESIHQSAAAEEALRAELDDWCQRFIDAVRALLAADHAHAEAIAEALASGNPLGATVMSAVPAPIRFAEPTSFAS